MGRRHTRKHKRERFTRLNEYEVEGGYGNVGGVLTPVEAGWNYSSIQCNSGHKTYGSNVNWAVDTKSVLYPLLYGNSTYLGTNQNAFTAESDTNVANAQLISGSTHMIQYLELVEFKVVNAGSTPVEMEIIFFSPRESFSVETAETIYYDLPGINNVGEAQIGGRRSISALSWEAWWLPQLFLSSIPSLDATMVLSASTIDGNGLSIFPQSGANYNTRTSGVKAVQGMDNHNLFDCQNFLTQYKILKIHKCDLSHSEQLNFSMSKTKGYVENIAAKCPRTLNDGNAYAEFYRDTVMCMITVKGKAGYTSAVPVVAPIAAGTANTYTELVMGRASACVAVEWRKKWKGCLGRTEGGKFISKYSKAVADNSLNIGGLGLVEEYVNFEPDPL